MRSALLVILILLMNGAQAATTLTIQSDTNDVLGKGTNYTTSTLSNYALSNQDIYFQDSLFSFSFIPPATDLNLAVKAYPDISGEYLMYIDRNNAADIQCYTSTSGEFFIYELDYSTPDTKLALDFTFYCNQTSGALRGSLRVNSDFPAPYSGPRASITAPRIAYEGEAVSLKGTNSFSTNADITGYQWTQLSGPQATLSNPGQADTQLILPQGIKPGGEDLSFRLTVTDTNGQPDNTTHHIRVPSKSDPQTYLQVQSSTGGTLNPDKGGLFNTGNSDIQIDDAYSDDNIRFYIETADQDWSVGFGSPMINGKYGALEENLYDEVEHNNHRTGAAAGLYISGDGNQCNTITGSFAIYQLKRDEKDGRLQAFQADFEQYCNGTSPLLTGIIAYNIKHESVPEADAGAAIEITENSVVNLDGSGSYDPIGTIQSYQWQGVDNELVINSATQSKASFSAPALNDGEDQRLLTFKLLVTDDEGYQSESEVTVKVVSANPATGVTANLRVFLQGAYDSSTQMMRDDLRQSGLIPTQQPYLNTSLAYNGDETASTALLGRTGETAPVDWVIAELHTDHQVDAPVAQKAAMLLRNGQVVDALNPDSPLRFKGVENGHYYIALNHRNHLKIITGTPVALTDSTNPVLIDFTKAAPDYPPTATHALWQNGGVSALWAGDTDLDQRIIASGPGNDKIKIITRVLSDPDNPQFAQNYIAKGYYATDLNLDGRVIYSGPDNDNNLLLQNILSHPGNTSFAENYVIRSTP